MSAAFEGPSSLEPPWVEVATLYRKVCVLRAEGRAPEAQLLEAGAFAHASGRALAGSSPGGESTLRAVMAAEESRVADAVVLCGLLGPMLAEQWALPAPARSPAPKRAPAPMAPGQRSIADFIDEMLAQERVGA